MQVCLVAYYYSLRVCFLSASRARLMREQWIAMGKAIWVLTVYDYRCLRKQVLEIYTSTLIQKDPTPF